MPKITPFLWFDTQAEEAANFYISIFKNSKIVTIARYGKAKLTEGGQEVQCGWLKDKFGLSWQVVPSALGEMMSDPNREKAKRVMQAMFKMKKIDIAALKKAYDQR